jgi:hypothetical protein
MIAKQQFCPTKEINTATKQHNFLKHKKSNNGHTLHNKKILAHGGRLTNYICKDT